MYIVIKVCASSCLPDTETIFFWCPSVTDPVSVQISGPNTVASLNESLDLVCHVDTRSGPLSGPSGRVVWYKDGQKVILREKIQHDTSLHFDSLLPSDAGFYQCETYVAMGQSSVFSLGYLLSCKYSASDKRHGSKLCAQILEWTFLFFIVDPWNISISGPDTVFPDRLSKFTCLVSCTLNVDCTVRWQFRGGFPIGIHFSVHENELKWIPSIPGTFQNFTCIVENAAAGRSVEANKMVEVKGTWLFWLVCTCTSALNYMLNAV